jgi:hypothetical protein
MQFSKMRRQFSYVPQFWKYLKLKVLPVIVAVVGLEQLKLILTVDFKFLLNVFMALVLVLRSGTLQLYFHSLI